MFVRQKAPVIVLTYLSNLFGEQIEAGEEIDESEHWGGRSHGTVRWSTSAGFIDGSIRQRG